MTLARHILLYHRKRTSISPSRNRILPVQSRVSSIGGDNELARQSGAFRPFDRKVVSFGLLLLYIVLIWLLEALPGLRLGLRVIPLWLWEIILCLWEITLGFWPSLFGFASSRRRRGSTSSAVPMESLLCPTAACVSAAHPARIRCPLLG